MSDIPLNDISGIVRADGLSTAESDELEALLDVYNRTRGRNTAIEAYYEGDVMAKDIGVDILPPDAKDKVNVSLSCDWARKSVHELSNLVRFDGFVFEDGEDERLADTLRRCNFESGLSRARIGTLKKGCSFACVNSTGGRANVRFHSADGAAAIMDGASDRLRSGIVFADRGRTPWSKRRPVVTQVNLHMVGNRVEIRRIGPSTWSATRVETPEGAMMMVPLVYAPTDTKPLGGSRISKPVRDIVDDVLRIRLALALSTAFYAVPMRALLGLTPELYKALSEKPQWTAYINPWLMATADRNGHAPSLSQLPSNSPSPLISLIENDARLFSSITGVPLNSLGMEQQGTVSADAILERRRGLVDEAQDLIDAQLKPALREIALLVMMVESNRASVDDLDDAQRSVMAHFKNPAMASIGATTDAAIKISSVNPAFASTDVFFEMVGFDQATIARANAQMRMNQARANVGARPILSQQGVGMAQQQSPQGAGEPSRAPVGDLRLTIGGGTGDEG